MKKILVIEDDKLLNKTISYNLCLECYNVDSVYLVNSAKKYILHKKYDLIVLDINLPDGNGFDLCKEIKQVNTDTLIIFLTANDMESDMIKGYELGADDYVTKPFPINVFKKKIHALFMRIDKQNINECYNDGYLWIDFSAFVAKLAGKDIILTPLEFRTVKLLINNADKVLTRQVLLEKLWDVDENYVDEHTLTTIISRIRNKIENADFQYIKTVYGMGYMWLGGDKT